MARARKAGDDAYNARRRVRRVISNLEKKLPDMTAKERKATEIYIAELQKQVNMSLQKNVGRSEEGKKKRDLALERLNKVGSVKKTPRQERANAIFRTQLNLAGSGDSSTSLGEHGPSFVKIFYKSTQHVWQGKPAFERNRLIMEHFGTTSLEEAMTRVLSANVKAIEALKAGNIQLDRTGMEETALAFYAGYEDETDAIGSPDYLAYTVPV